MVKMSLYVINVGKSSMNIAKPRAMEIFKPLLQKKV